MAYNEFWLQPGRVRQSHELLFSALQGLGEAGMQRLERQVSAHVRHQEVSFNLLGDPGGTSRRWQLDPLPLLWSEREFEQLSAGVSQRAQLLHEILADVYGEQELLHAGVVPDALVLGSPRYFRSLHRLAGLPVPGLVLYALDVGRRTEGGFEVYSDRTAAPAGAGYALENRLVIGQVHAELFRAAQTQKLNSFFSLFRETLQGQAGTEAPRMVLLTPGLQDESWFEHAYLARYLGLDLVEGRDLSVRGEEVFLKTLEGLKKVDLIFRRQMDDWCDPLELREDSLSGVSGLVAAVRAGQVQVVNPLGSGLLELPAWKAYLEPIQRYLFGEPLRLPSVPCRWLGDPLHREEVCDSWERWILKPALEERRAPVQELRSFNRAERERLWEKILQAPHRYVAEEWRERSVSPLGADLSSAVSTTVRLFACREERGYRVMPGGLVRLGDNPDGIFLSGSSSVMTKDLWIPQGVAPSSPLAPRQVEKPLTLRRGGLDVPSRLVDDIFWLSRSVQRCDHVARLARTGLELLTSDRQEMEPELGLALHNLLLNVEGAPLRGEQAELSLEQMFIAAVYDPQRLNSIRSILSRVAQLARTGRAHWSRDTQDALRRLQDVLSHDERGPGSLDAVLVELQEFIILLAAVHGIFSSNLVRGYAWMFVEMGERIERGAFLNTLLQHLFPASPTPLKWETLLHICESALTYRSRYLNAFQAEPVVDLIVTDDTNPVSLLFQIQRLLECVRHLPAEPRFPPSQAEKRLLSWETRLLTADLTVLCARNGEELRRFALEGQALLFQVSDDLTRSYFNPTQLFFSEDQPRWTEEWEELR